MRYKVNEGITDKKVKVLCKCIFCNCHNNELIHQEL